MQSRTYMSSNIFKSACRSLSVCDSLSLSLRYAADPRRASFVKSRARMEHLLMESKLFDTGAYVRTCMRACVRVCGMLPCALVFIAGVFPILVALIFWSIVVLIGSFFCANWLMCCTDWYNCVTDRITCCTELSSAFAQSSRSMRMRIARACKPCLHFRASTWFYLCVRTCLCI